MMPKKILVIEDDKDIRDTIMFTLQRRGYEVIASENAKILKTVKDIDPDLILLDNWLSDWKSDANGQQLSKELKSSQATAHIPVVIISAVSNIREISEAALADGYLKKPFELEELIGVAERFVRK
ncbi:response regulator [Mucilaginibacter sp. RS28]|uniref:Response regulator n=1 Tax=Mucilaginibacter straminoryzae TaxID=2932774 RepID=A0A9X1X4M7_9SPHI|nr:response regulator [Mucilaginibacter straminoryzae]MCJ8208549.1 response regulator [Mucilaginibacter straminoryzae]